ncbi:hypothetical protein [Leucobacter luti]|uniref:hypothetical protein n=1 Tax=Leucobacter luti TaxID=340320 RepID=UPI003D0454FA
MNESPESSPAPPPEEVARWELSGGEWRVASAGADSATVELLRCDAGEVVEILRLTDPAAVAWARAARTPGARGC